MPRWESQTTHAGRSIGDLLRRQAATRPHEVAFCCQGAQLSWVDVERRSMSLAGRLASAVPEGGRVAILTRSCHRHWEALFACANAGVIAVPLNYRWLPAEVAAVLADCAAEALVVDLALPLEGEDADVLSCVKLAIGFNGTDPRVETYETVVASPVVDVDGRLMAEVNVIGYTSGTTGRPKGAATTHTSAVMSALWFAALFGMSSTSRFLACMPIYVYRGGAAGLAPVVVGARSVMLDFDADQVLNAIADDHITHAVLAPIMVERLLAHPEIDSFDLSSLEGVWIGGAPSAPESITRLQERVGGVVGSVYGMTEAVGIASMRWPRTDASDPLLRSVGRSSPLLDVMLLVDDGTPALPGATGELFVRGETVMAGYWPDVDGGGLTDGWFATGDIASRDVDGYLHLVDRRVDIVNSGGLNVYTLEVEQALLEHPSVAACAVVGAQDTSYGETVAAFIEIAPGAAATSWELLEHCRGRLSGYKCPRAITFVDQLPRNAMGKVDKAVLRGGLWSGGRGIAGESVTS